MYTKCYEPTSYMHNGSFTYMENDVEHYFSTETLLTYITPTALAHAKVLEHEGCLYYVSREGMLYKWIMGSNSPTEIMAVDISYKQPTCVYIFDELYIKLPETAYINTNDLREWYDAGCIIQTCEYGGRKFVITVSATYKDNFYSKEYTWYNIKLYADKRLINEVNNVYVKTEAYYAGITEINLIKTRYRYLRDGMFQFGGHIISV